MTAALDILLLAVVVPLSVALGAGERTATAWRHTEAILAARRRRRAAAAERS